MMATKRKRKKAAALELLLRRRARSSLLDFTNYTWAGYKAEPAHALIAGVLDLVVEREIDRVMIFAPPQHGKSELVSVRFPAYWLGRQPDEPVILSSYGALLAESKSRQARGVVESVEFQSLFPGVATSRFSRAVADWLLAEPHRGSMLAVGVGGPITGHGCRVGIIDDPFESWAQAQSETWRNRVWDWYRGTFRTRVWEGGAIVMICTRWHEDDLAGRLMMDQPGEWSILRLPAVAETQEERDAVNARLGLASGQVDPLGRAPGEALCPGRFSAGELARLRREVGDLAFSAEYQGSPTRPEGNRLKRWMFPIVDAPLADALRVRYWDNAATGDGGCYTAGVLMAINERGVICIEDVARGQWESADRDTVMDQVAELDAGWSRNAVHIVVEREGGSAGKDVQTYTIKRLAGFPIEFDHVTGSKDVRLEPFISQAQAGNVFLLRGAWNGAYIEEMCAIPNGAHRDQADGSAGGFNWLCRFRELGVESSPVDGYRG
jgi:predicted phage terminase large subunit-like protein